MAAKQLDNDAPLVVYGFAGSILIPTDTGSYWAYAVGGRVESRPTGNPFVLFALEYIWDAAGMPLAFPAPIRIRLNTSMAVTESVNFAFPEAEPEVQPEAAPVVEDPPLAHQVYARDGEPEAAPVDFLEHPDNEDDELEEDFRDELEEDEEEDDELEEEGDDEEEDDYVDPDEIDAEVSELPYN